MLALQDTKRVLAKPLVVARDRLIDSKDLFLHRALLCFRPIGRSDSSKGFDSGLIQYGLFPVYCEETFTTEHQRGRAATKGRNIFGQRRKACPERRRRGRKGKNESELGVLGVLARE